MPRPRKEPDTSTFVGQIAANIRRRRVKMFARAEDAAEAAGVPTQTWYHWEQGILPLKSLPTIAAAIGCKPKQLLPY